VVIRDNKKKKKENKTKKWGLYKSGLQERSNIVCHLDPGSTVNNDGVSGSELLSGWMGGWVEILLNIQTSSGNQPWYMLSC